MSYHVFMCSGSLQMVWPFQSAHEIQYQEQPLLGVTGCTHVHMLLCLTALNLTKELANYTMAVTKTRTGLGLDWRWTGDGLEHFSFLTHLNNHF